MLGAVVPKPVSLTGEDALEGVCQGGQRDLPGLIISRLLNEDRLQLGAVAGASTVVQKLARRIVCLVQRLTNAVVPVEVPLAPDKGGCLDVHNLHHRCYSQHAVMHIPWAPPMLWYHLRCR